VFLVPPDSGLEDAVRVFISKAKKRKIHRVHCTKKRQHTNRDSAAAKNALSLASTGEGTPNPVVALAPPAAVGVQGTPDSQTKAGESSSEVPIGESSIAKQDLKYEPFVKFEDGWAQTIEWFKVHWLSNYQARTVSKL
jgi:nucleoside-diphosphate-sugar epimerase